MDFLRKVQNKLLGAIHHFLGEKGKQNIATSIPRNGPISKEGTVELISYSPVRALFKNASELRDERRYIRSYL